MTNAAPSRESEGDPMSSDASLCPDRPFVAVVDPRVLIAECFVAALQRIEPSLRFGAAPSLQSLAQISHGRLAMVIVCVPAGRDVKAACLDAHERLKLDWPQLPLAIVADDETSATVLGCIDAGARGYIPTSLSVAIVVQVLRLVQAGCTFVPPNVVQTLMHPAEAPAASTPTLNGTQLQIADRIRRGTPNKVIAHQLGMSENAVKIQVRSIMRKMKVRNRTELSFRSSHLFA